MKARLSVILAFLAALALVFAASCSDSSDDVWNDDGASATEQEGGASSGSEGESSGSGENAGNVDGNGGASAEGGTGAGSEGASSGDAGGSGENAGNVDDGASATEQEGGASSGSEGASSGDAGGSGENAGNVDGNSGASAEGGTGGASESASSGDAGGAGENAGNADGNGGASAEGGTGAGSEGEQDIATLIAITEDDVQEFLRGIETVRGNSAYNASKFYWDFANGTLGLNDDVGLAFTVSWVNTEKSDVKPGRSTTISSMQGLGAVSNSLLSVNFTDVQWTQEPSGSSKAEGISPSTTGIITVEIELSSEASSTHEIPESLKSVSIMLIHSSWRYT